MTDQRERSTMWLKICGIRDVATAQAVAELGPSAIGLNFFSESPRRCELPVAQSIVRNLPATVEPVGLFVNHAVEEIRRVAADCELRTIQLHGDEPPELLAELPEFRILRAF